MTKREVLNQDFYFSNDGSYGSAEDMVILDTSDWTADDWDVIEYSTDMHRVEAAEMIWRKYNG